MHKMWSPILILFCPFACAGFTRFSRQPVLENKKIVDATPVVMTTVSLDYCARECHDNSSCMSFLHNQDGGRCQMMSRLHIDSEDSVLEDGNKIFAKNGDDAVCPIPEVISNGRVLYTDGLMEGSIAEFVCDDYYYQTTETGVCDIFGTWQGLDNACTSRQTPLFLPTSGKLVPGSCFTVIGTPTLETLFTIVLYQHQSASETVLHFSARFDLSNTINTIVLNSRTNYEWGTEERHPDFWPFAINQEFNITICLEETLFRITVDDMEIATFVTRHANTNSRTLRISQSVAVRRVRFTT